MLPNHFISADEQAELQLFTESLERFCDAEIEPHYRTWEKAGRVPRDLLRKMGENGYLCADVPDELTQKHLMDALARGVRVAHPVRAGAPRPLGRRRAVDLDHLGNFQEKRRRMLHSLAVVMLAVLSGSMLRIPVKSTCHSVLS